MSWSNTKKKRTASIVWDVLDVAGRAATPSLYPSSHSHSHCREPTNARVGSLQDVFHAIPDYPVFQLARVCICPVWRGLDRGVKR